MVWEKIKSTNKEQEGKTKTESTQITRQENQKGRAYKEQELEAEFEEDIISSNPSCNSCRQESANALQSFFVIQPFFVLSFFQVYLAS
jgi:hypothetical protein